MLVTTIILVLITSNSISAQASCDDDVQCSDGCFCERSTYTCRPCMECKELNRKPLPKLEEHICVKSDYDCGPCLENYSTHQWNSKCVLPENEPIANIVWFTCAATGLLIVHVGIFMYVIIHTNMYETVDYKIYVTTNQAMSLQLSVRGFPKRK